MKQRLTFAQFEKTDRLGRCAAVRDSTREFSAPECWTVTADDRSGSIRRRLQFFREAGPSRKCPDSIPIVFSIIGGTVFLLLTRRRYARYHRSVYRQKDAMPLSFQLSVARCFDLPFPTFISTKIVGAPHLSDVRVQRVREGFHRKTVLGKKHRFNPATGNLICHGSADQVRTFIYSQRGRRSDNPTAALYEYLVQVLSQPHEWATEYAVLREWSIDHYEDTQA